MVSTVMPTTSQGFGFCSTTILDRVDEVVALAIKVPCSCVPVGVEDAGSGSLLAVRSLQGPAERDWCARDESCTKEYGEGLSRDDWSWIIKTGSDQTRSAIPARRNEVQMKPETPS